MVLVAVAVGGAAGSCLRFFAGAWFLKVYPEFPWGTVLVNILGSFAIGFAFPFLSSVEDHIRHFIIAGFLGGLTTMSGFSLETVTLLTGGRYGAAAANWVLGSVLTLLCCWIGILASRQLT